jgi:hypothetical protein
MDYRLAYKTTDHVDVAKHLMRYLTSVYGEAEAGEYREACHSFSEERERLRLAVRAERVTGEQLQRYYALLTSAAAHFPVSQREGDARLAFVWHDALVSGRKCTQHNLGLERAGECNAMISTLPPLPQRFFE